MPQMITLQDKTPPPIGVLIMAYGAPTSIEEIPGYLADIRHGRPTPQRVVDDITENYRAIGGSSPLLSISRRQMQAIAEHFDPEHYRFYLGMRHWQPWIEETVGGMIKDGIERAVSLTLAPHYSDMSIARYQQKIQSGLELYRGEIHFQHIDAYHNLPELVQAFAQRVQQGISQWPEEKQDRVHVVFSAHSLPKRILDTGDPYEEQLLSTADKIAAEVGLEDQHWSWSYQSAGRSDEAWLGPQLVDHLPDLAKQGIQDVVIVPIGFVSDHVEILYDIDIEAQAVARRNDMRLERPIALNTHPLFIKGLADLIKDHADKLPQPEQP